MFHHSVCPPSLQRLVNPVVKTIGVFLVVFGLSVLSESDNF